MKKLLLLILLTSSINIAFSQTPVATTTPVVENKLTTKFYGYIRTDVWYDSRESVSARNGLITLVPADIKKDKNGDDINAHGNFNYSAISSRAGVKFGGMTAFGANVDGLLEADFTGASNVTTSNFRLRHAYIKLNWKKSNLLIGQYWHPLYVTNVAPSVVSINAGAPFQPFNRSPQIRYTYNTNNFSIIAAIISQQDYMSSGPIGSSYKYLSNSLTPNFHLQVQYSKNANTFGLAVDNKTIVPRIVSDSAVIVKESLPSTTFMAFYKYSKNALQFKTEAILGQNMSDNLMLGGYSVSTIDSTNDKRTYTPTHHFTMWADLSYTQKLSKFDVIYQLFGGYSKNLGTSENNIGTYYGFGNNIENLLRVAPSVTFKSGNVNLAVEFEHTQAAYGSIQQDGTIINTHSVANNRLLLAAWYLF